jgi:hypothetical protein
MGLRRTRYLVSAAALSLFVVSVPARRVHAQPLPAELSDTYRAKRHFYGCWQVKWPQPASARWPSETTWCFHPGRAIGGATFDAGDGWDFCKRWRVDGQRLMVRDNYGHAQVCTYAFSKDRQSLVLSNCPAAGDWRRNGELSKVSRESWGCRTQDGSELTGDGSVEP